MSNVGDLGDGFDESFDARLERLRAKVGELVEATRERELALERVELFHELPGAAPVDAVIQAAPSGAVAEVGGQRSPERGAEVLRREILRLEELRRNIPIELRDALDAVSVERATRLPVDSQKKLRKLLGVFDVRRQEQLGMSFAESSLTQLAASFDAPLAVDYPGRRDTYEDVQRALAEVRRRLGIDAGEPVLDRDLCNLLSSADPAERAAGLGLLERLSRACGDPAAIEYAMRHGQVVALRQNLRGDDALQGVEVQTSFIKAARSKLALMMFQTVVHDAIAESAAGIFAPPERIHEFVALVGFNRVMSANNLLGASLASDVDFNLVIDDAPMMAAGISREQVVALRDALGRVVDDAERMLRQQGVTLDVGDYTVKMLSEVAALGAAEPARRGTEKGFLSTIVHNQLLLSGSAAVQRNYVGAIETLIEDDDLAVLAFDQYLGDSSKGSLKAFMHLGAIYRAGDGGDDGTPMFAGYPPDARGELLRTLRGSVGNYNYVGRDDFGGAGPWRFSTKLLACRLNDYFDAVPLARYQKAVGGGDRSTAAFAERYVTVRPIAAATNRFGVQIQDRIYELLAGEAADQAALDAHYTEVTSEELGRVLASESGRQKLLLTLDAMTAELGRSLEPPLENGSAEAREFRAAATAELKRIQRAARQLRQQGGVDSDADAGRKLFVSLGALVKHSAVFLDPSRPQPPAAPVGRAPSGRRHVKKSNQVRLRIPSAAAAPKAASKPKRKKKSVPPRRWR